MNPPVPSRRPSIRERAFSLVEVTLAIGIVAFAFVALFGLVPTGLNVFRSAIDSSIGSQILEQVVQGAQQTDYAYLLQAYVPYTTYYDEQGNLLIDAKTGQPITDTKDQRSVYTVQAMAKTPTTVPTTGSGAPNTTSNIATLTVKVAKNPGHNPDPFQDSNKANVNVYIAYVARNKSAFESAKGY